MAAVSEKGEHSLGHDFIQANRRMVASALDALSIHIERLVQPKPMVGAYHGGYSSPDPIAVNRDHTP